MKNFALLMTMSFCLGCCDKREAPVTAADSKIVSAAPADILVKRIGQTGEVSFKSWNGNLRGLDNDDVLHFYADSKIVLEHRSIGVDHFRGTYDMTPDGRVAVAIKGFHESWPPMVLGVDGTDLLLYREDGHASWLPKGDPNLPEPSVDGFWPFRATAKTPAQQDAP
jgi:hypothetical protein